MNPTKELPVGRRKFGALTYTGQKLVDGVRLATVKCSCGVTRDVRFHDLIRGRISSCGRGACKKYRREKPNPKYRPRKTTVCSLDVLEAAWGAYTAPTLADRRPLRDISQSTGIAPSTLTYLTRAIRRAGGWEQYKAKVTKHGEEA